MKYKQHKPSSPRLLLLLGLISFGFVLSLFAQLFLGLQHLNDDLRGQMKLYVYLEDSLQGPDILQFKASLIKFPQVMPNIAYTSKEQAAQSFLQSTQENYEDLLGEENPFKNHFTLSIRPEFQQQSTYQRLAKALEQRPEVFEVSYPNQYLSLLIDKSAKVLLVILALSVALLVIVYLQISNYIRLMIYANRTLIKSMQLLGSTDGFIQKPYLIQSFYQGILASLGVIVLVLASNFYIANHLPELNVVLFKSENLLKVFGLSTLVILCFAFIATFVSLKKYLKIPHTNLF